MIRRWFIVGLILAAWGGGCAKPPDLPDIPVNAATPADFLRFRTTELGERFPPDRLGGLRYGHQRAAASTPLQRSATAAAREADMLRVATGEILGPRRHGSWAGKPAARASSSEIAELDGMLQRDLQQQARTATTGTPDAVVRRIGSEREVLVQLHGNLAATDARLASAGRVRSLRPACAESSSRAPLRPSRHQSDGHEFVSGQPAWVP